MNMEISTSASGNLKLIHILYILVYRIKCFEDCYLSHYVKDKLRY